MGVGIATYTYTYYSAVVAFNGGLLGDKSASTHTHSFEDKEMEMRGDIRGHMTLTVDEQLNRYAHEPTEQDKELNGSAL